MDATTMVATAIRQTLYNNLAYSAAIPKATYWERAPDGTETPFVILQHYRGGELNTAKVRMIDAQWKVYVVSSSADVARSTANLIYTALQDVWPVCTGLDLEGYCSIEQTVPFTENKVVQNLTFWLNGGIYRVRLTERK